MQKLVTIYLDAHVFMEGRWMAASFADKHGFVQEHLQNYLEDGWSIVSMSSFGGSEGMGARGWLAVVLEKKP